VNTVSNAPVEAKAQVEGQAPQSAVPVPSALPLTCGGFPAAGQPEPDFGPYLAQVQTKIRAHWHPPTVDQPKHVVVLYRIACDGHLVRVGVKTSSGLAVADQAALAAVKSAAPFPPLPMTYVGRNVDVEFDFDYEMMASRKPQPVSSK
jgi:TonB family protein